MCSLDLSQESGTNFVFEDISKWDVQRAKVIYDNQ